MRCTCLHTNLRFILVFSSINNMVTAARMQYYARPSRSRQILSSLVTFPPLFLLRTRGYQTPDFDTKFNSARALSITAIILGGAAWFSLMLGSCCKLDQSKLRGLSCYFFLATLFQGLSLLMIRSNVCTPGFFNTYFTEPGTAAPSTIPAWMAGVSCGLSKGSKLAISATVLWFVCNNMVHAAIVPDPLWKGGYQETPGGGARALAAGDEQPEQALCFYSVYCLPVEVSQYDK